MTKPMSVLNDTQFRRYKEYVPSPDPALGSLPVHWSMMRLKRIADVRYGLGEPPKLLDGGLPFVRATDISRGRIFRAGMQHVDPDDVPFERAPALRTGDVVVVRSGAYTGDSAIVPPELEGAIVGYDLVVRCKSGIPAFVAYCLLSTHVLQNQMDLCRARAAQPHLNAEELGDCILPWPSRDEQEGIVRFLDRNTVRIDVLIEKKDRLIGLLEEKRAALINRAVTKGLDPGVPMKDSGIPWLGAVPAHWRIERLKFVAALQTGLTLGKDYTARETVVRPYLRVANVQDGYLDLETVAEVHLPAGDVSRYELRLGDVLMTEGGDFDKLGRGRVWSDEIPGCLHQNHVFAVRPRASRLHASYLASVTASHYGKAYFTSTSQQTTNLACTNSTKIRDFPTPLPPYSEQILIMETVEQVTSGLDAVIAKIREQIGKFQEYRTALISAAVTGKIDVRETGVDKCSQIGEH